jgi:hypothetical protein
MAQHNEGKGMWVSPELKRLGTVVEMTQDKIFGTPDDGVFVRSDNGDPAGITGSE